jgi:dUTP pyrophosphatase
MIPHASFITPQPTLQFYRSRNVQAPRRGTALSAGFDFHLPDDAAPITLAPNESLKVPSGVHVRFDPRYVLIAFNKSGVAANKSLLIGAQVIDADYTGEVHIDLHNVGTETQTFEPGQKLTQFILLEVGLLDTVESGSLEALYADFDTERGAGGFGSTGA